MTVSLLFEIALWAAAVTLAVPVAVFAVEVLASLWPNGAGRRGAAVGEPSPRVTVLVPAHDEEAVIGPTLNALFAACGPDDRVLVVADNCTDTTAELARILGAEVVERHDTERRGKGYALAFGVDHLRRAPSRRHAVGLDGSDALPPDVVIVVDADCRVSPSTIRRLAGTVAATGRPVQSRNLVEAAAKPSALQAVSVLGFRFKNLVRALGMSRLGLPCHLTGTGMALPWSIAERMSFGGGNLVEDMQLGIDLAIGGFPAVFEPEASVTSAVPQAESAFVTQRSRWESGHVATAIRNVPRLVWHGVRRGRPELLALALDLCVPPLSLFVCGWIAATVAAFVGELRGLSPWPAVVLGVSGVLLAGAILLGWAVHCRHVVPGTTFVAVPWFVVRKLPIYLAMPFRRKRTWVRTAREVGRSPASTDPLADIATGAHAERAKRVSSGIEKPGFQNVKRGEP